MSVVELQKVTRRYVYDHAPLCADLVEQGDAEAALLGEWGAGPDLQAAALLRPLAQHDPALLTAPPAVCSARTAQLCADYLHFVQLQPDAGWSGSPYALDLARSFMAAYCDAELAMLRIAALWQRVGAGLPLPKQQRHAAIEEGRKVLMPLLRLLGMFALRVDLEEQLLVAEGKPFVLDDAARQTGAAIAAELADRLPEATVHINKYAQVHNLLGGSRGAPKLSLLPTVTVLVEDEAACYGVLHQVHRLYAPVDGGIDDSLYAPEHNGYRALNIWAVANAPGGRARVSFSVVPRDQHEVNEWGLAAHVMRYRRQQPTPGAWWNDAAARYEQITAAPLGAQPEKLYVFTPKGELFAFDRGSTVVDFAYAVHSEVAEQCRSFLVNGRPVEPATQLRHLDLVELEHDPQAPGPTRFWLNAASTPRARGAIERYLKRKGQGSHHGQKIIEERLKFLERHYGFHLPAEKVEQAVVEAMRRENLSRREDLLEAVAAGQFAADAILHPLFEREVLRQVEVPRTLRLRPHQLFLAQCCRPRPGDAIVGRLYYRHGELVHMTLHNAQCARIAGLADVAPLHWRLEPTLAVLARLEVRALDDVGLLGAAVQAVYDCEKRASLLRVHAASRHGSAHIYLDVRVDQPATLQELVETLRRLPNYTIGEVSSLALPPSEQEEWADNLAGGPFNPYSRLPVHESAMFFGRSEERTCIVERLLSRQPCVWLIGQKRVGKTSLLLHLRDHELAQRGFAPVFVDFQLMDSPSRANVFFELANAVYASLSSDVQLSSAQLGFVGAPLRSLFDADPANQLIAYLLGVQELLGARRLVLLLDEFSRLTDAHLHGKLDAAFFDRCRAMLHATMAAGVGYVVVIQQQTHDSLVQTLEQNPDDPSWRLMDVGLSLTLGPLPGDDVRRLIEWPMRNHLEYTPAIVDRVATLCGGSPFLAQAFCYSLVLHMARRQRSQVTAEDLDAVCAEFMQPHDYTFAHMTEMTKGISNHVVAVMARLAAAQPGGCVGWEAVAAALPNVAPDSLRTSLRSLTERSILVEPAPQCWRFSSLLFQQWLAVNSW